MSVENDTDIQILKKDIEIDKGDVLGRGGFGHVFAGYMADGTKVAVKLLIDQGSLPNRNVIELRKEARRLKELSQHLSIIDLCGVLLETDSYGLVLEFMLFGNASQFVRSYKVDIPILLRMTCQVASAMMHLHSYDPPILHLDLKADNVLIDSWFNAKVSDFGLSEWKTVTKMVTTGGSPVSRRCTLTHIAPEVLKDVNQKSTVKLDIYAFGITVWEFFAAQRPYGNKNEEVIRNAVCNNQRPGLGCLGPSCPFIISLMINKCWKGTPEMRPTFKSIDTEMQKAFEDHKDRLNNALKSIRQQIREKHVVNDPEYVDTMYIDDMEENMEPDQIDAVPMETEVVNDPQGEDDEDSEIIGEQGNDASAVLKPSPQLEYHPKRSEISEDEKQLRRVLCNPLAFEMVRSGLDNTIPLSPEMCEVVRDPVKLRAYINNDSTLRSELLRSGSPLLSKLNTPSIRDSAIQGRNEQRLNKKLGSQISSNHIRTSLFLTPGEHRRLSRAQSLRDCAYTSKLMKNGVGEKLLKALREPSKLQTAVESNHSNNAGGQQKFETLDRPIMDAAQDPFLLQILVAQDPSMLDNLMTDYPDMMMKLISANKTNLKTRSSGTASTSVQHGRKGMQQNINGMPPQTTGDIPQQNLSGMPTQNIRGMPPQNVSGMPPQTIRGMPPQNISGMPPQNIRGMPPQNIRGMPPQNISGMPPQNIRGMPPQNIREMPPQNIRGMPPQNIRGMQDKRDVMQDFDLSRLQRMGMENGSRNGAIPKSRQSNPSSQQNGIPSMLRMEDTRRRTGQTDKDKHNTKDDKRDKTAENQRKIEKPKKEIKRENEARENEPRMKFPEQLASMVSVDEFSLKEDELSGTVPVPPGRSHANPLAPRPESTPNPPSPIGPRSHDTASRHNSDQEISVKPEPPSVQIQNQSNQVSGEMPSSSTTPPTGKGGATGWGGAKGGATGGDTKNITISHAHAGGGFSHITINQDMQSLPNIQVGNSNMMVIGNDTDSDDTGTSEDHSSSKKKQKRHREIKLPDQPIDMDRLDIVCTGIGKDWKKLSRALGLDDALIEQIHQDYHINGTYEIMYQALHKWIQKNGKAATIRVLGEHLSRIGRFDLMKKIK